MNARICFLVLSSAVLIAQVQPPAPLKPPSPAEQRIAWNQAHYTKTEVMVPMRDGKRLHTVIYAPKDRSRAYPILFSRTPYGQSDYGSDTFPERMIAGITERSFYEDGFIFVGQDVRGRFMSAQGDWVEVRPLRTGLKAGETDESTDAFDTVEWLLKNLPNHNGQVGLYGQSYNAFFATSALVRQHPAIKAAILQAPPMDSWMGDDNFRNGAFHLVQSVEFFASYFRPQLTPTPKAEEFTLPYQDPYRFFLKAGSLPNLLKAAGVPSNSALHEILAHPSRDAFAEARNLTPHLKDVSAAVLVVGGWFDNEDLNGPLMALRQLNNGSPKAPIFGVFGPWIHGGWRRDVTRNRYANADNLGSITFGQGLSKDFEESVELPFLRHFLKGEGTFTQPKVKAFATGSNVWQAFETWPPREVRPVEVFLRDGDRLGFEPPTDPKQPSDSFESDPTHPVPYTAAITNAPYWEAYPTEDQRFASSRPDVLTYETDPLTEGKTIAGPIQADLWTSTTATDADWVVKVIDVWPEDASDPEGLAPGQRMAGYQQLVRGDILRGKYRNSLAKPEPMTPGKPTPIRLSMLDCFHTFKKGHRIMVQIQSSWFPLFDRNPQVFMDNVMDAKPEDFRKATHTVFRSKDMPSRILLPVLPQGQH